MSHPFKDEPKSDALADTPSSGSKGFDSVEFVLLGINLSATSYLVYRFYQSLDPVGMTPVSSIARSPLGMFFLVPWAVLIASFVSVAVLRKWSFLYALAVLWLAS